MTSGPPRIVVVDDEPALAEMVCAILDDEGLHALRADVGRHTFLFIQRELPDIVILDVQMPIVDGIEIFQQMRADPQTATIPVIFLTANEHIVEQRMPDYTMHNAVIISKPFDMMDLLEVVQQLTAQ